MRESSQKPGEQERPLYADDIMRLIRNREGQQWVTFQNPETIDDPKFFGELQDSLRQNERMPVLMQTIDLPPNKQLAFMDLWSALVKRTVFSLPKERRPEFAEFLEESGDNDPRDRFWKLMAKLQEEGGKTTVIWQRIEDFFERLPDKDQRKTAALSLFKVFRKNARYMALVGDEKKLNEVIDGDVRMAFNEAMSAKIKK